MKEKFTLKDGNILYVIPDDNSMNPRLEFDNFGHMACFHTRYDLGDKDENGPKRSFIKIHNNTEDMLSHITGMHPDDPEFENTPYLEVLATIMDVALKIAIILPLRLLDHSGVSMSIGKGAHQSDPGGWDSGQVGWIYKTFAEARTEFKVDEENTVEEWYGPKKGERIPLVDIIIRILEGEVETYDQYLRGEVYGFKLVKPVTKTWINKDDPAEEFIETIEEDQDSCWGFYGSNHQESGLYDHVGITKEDILEREEVND